MTNATMAANKNMATTEVLPDLARPFKLLVVEDDTSVEALWRGIVERAVGHARMDWSTSEVEAESLILKARSQGEQYDLVIADIFLSGSRTGIDLWQRHHDELRGRIIMTSGINYAKFNRYFENEDDRPIYLQKPLVTHECIEVVNQILNRRIYV